MTERIKSIVVTGGSVAFPEAVDLPKAPEVRVPPGEYTVTYIANPSSKGGPQLVVIDYGGKRMGITERGWFMRASRENAGFSLNMATVVSVKISKSGIMLPVLRWTVIGVGPKKEPKSQFELPMGSYAIAAEESPAGSNKPPVYVMTHVIDTTDPHEEVTVGMTMLDWHLRENPTAGIELVLA